MRLAPLDVLFLGIYLTAFNSVWTYDIYQAYIRPHGTDAHYLWVGRAATLVGIAVSIATAYVAMRFNNIMDMLQLVFSFVNAPLFATFLLGMFWRGATGHGAFWGLVAGTGAAGAHYLLTEVAGASSLVSKLAVLHVYPSDMAQNLWGAIWAWTTCFLATVLVSLVTHRRPDAELAGLVYGLTPRDAGGERHWLARPASLGAIVLGLTLVLNAMFW